VEKYNGQQARGMNTDCLPCCLSQQADTSPFNALRVPSRPWQAGCGSPLRSISAAGRIRGARFCGPQRQPARTTVRVQYETPFGWTGRVVSYWRRSSRWDDNRFVV